jgi:antitoxin VapB
MAEARIAKLFSNGGSQAVRLPAEFRFDGDEVYVRRDPASGDVILSRRDPRPTWSEFFAMRDATDVPADFMEQRLGNEPGGWRDPFDSDAR